MFKTKNLICPKCNEHEFNLFWTVNKINCGPLYTAGSKRNVVCENCKAISAFNKDTPEWPVLSFIIGLLLLATKESLNARHIYNIDNLWIDIGFYFLYALCFLVFCFSYWFYEYKLELVDAVEEDLVD
jgi:hypothetical protein